MHNNKKASAKAGQKKTHAHFPWFAGELQANGLTPVYQGWHDAFVPETKGNEIGVSNITGGRIRRHGGFFTSIACTASSMAGLAGEGQPSPVPVFRYANLASACHPIGVGCGIETANTGVHAMRLTASGKPAHTFTLASSLTRYRVFRCFLGTVLAHRLAFAGRASA